MGSQERLTELTSPFSLKTGAITSGCVVMESI